MAGRYWNHGSKFDVKSNLRNDGNQPIAPFAYLLLALLISGCESSSTIDSVMNSKDAKESTVSKPAQGTGTGFGELVGTNKASEASTSQLPGSAPPTPNSGESGQKSMGLGAAGINSDLSDVSTRLDPPKISRSDFVIRLSIPAQEKLLEETKKPGRSYLLVGKVTPTTDDLQNISFVDFFEPDRQFQIRANGVKILVPLELVNRLHNATIDLDPDSKQYFVTLAR